MKYSSVVALLLSNSSAVHVHMKSRSATGTDRILAQQAQIPDRMVYEGCFEYKLRSSANGMITNVGGLTMGANRCFGFANQFGDKNGWTYVGIANGSQCQVDKAPGPTGKRLPDAECSFECKGAKGMNCGSDKSISVWKILNAADAAAAKSAADAAAAKLAADMAAAKTAADATLANAVAHKNAADAAAAKTAADAAAAKYAADMAAAKTAADATALTMAANAAAAGGAQRIPGPDGKCYEYIEPAAGGCTNGHNISKESMTFQQCEDKCNSIGPKCRGIEYFTQSDDANIKSSSTYTKDGINCMPNDTDQADASCPWQKWQMKLYAKVLVPCKTPAPDGFCYDYPPLATPGCTNGHNISRHSMTFEECENECNRIGPKCKGIEYFTPKVTAAIKSRSTYTAEGTNCMPNDTDQASATCPWEQWQMQLYPRVKVDCMTGGPFVPGAAGGPGGPGGPGEAIGAFVALSAFEALGAGPHTTAADEAARQARREAMDAKMAAEIAAIQAAQKAAVDNAALKAMVDAAAAKAAADAAAVTAAAASKCMQYTPQENLTNITGCTLPKNHLNMLPGQTEWSCQRACNSTPKCKSFEFFIEHGDTSKKFNPASHPGDCILTDADKSSGYCDWMFEKRKLWVKDPNNQCPQ